jgi:hypothetical protein
LARPRSQPANAVCHPERPAYSRSLCRGCYDAVRWTGRLPRTLVGETRGAAEDCARRVPRAGRKPPEDSAYIRTDRPSVAKHVAVVAVKNCLDMEKAVKEMKPGLTRLQVAETSEKLEGDPNVRNAIERTLAKRGLDEKSKEHFVELLWRYAESEDPRDERRQLQALRILGKAFVGERVEVREPTPLKIHGYEEGIRRMFGDVAGEVLDS